MTNSINKINLNNIKATISNFATKASNIGSTAQKAANGLGGDALQYEVPTSRKTAFRSSFKNSVSGYAAFGAKLPGRLDGVAAGLKAPAGSHPVISALRNGAFQAVSLGLAFGKVVGALGGALVGVVAGIGTGVKAAATYRASVPAQQATEQTTVKESYQPMTDAIKTKSGSVSHPLDMSTSEASTPKAGSPKAASNPSGTSELTEQPVAA